MLINGWKRCMASAMALAISSGTTQAKPVWREAFQSSPAAYEAASESFVKFAAEHWHLPADKLRLELTPRPVSGTVRYRITVQAAGSKLRIRLSNEEGSAPLRLSAASIGVAGDAFAVRLGSLHALTFAGAAGVTIPVGAPVLSDPVDLAVKSGAKLIVSAALPPPMMNEGRGGAGFVIAPGNQAMQTALDQAAPIKGRPLVTGVSVPSEAPPHVIVALGDSVTDWQQGQTRCPAWLARSAGAQAGGAQGRRALYGFECRDREQPGALARVGCGKHGKAGSGCVAD